jgi:hypothetical protein
LCLLLHASELGNAAHAAVDLCGNRLRIHGMHLVWRIQGYSANQRRQEHRNLRWGLLKMKTQEQAGFCLETSSEMQRIELRSCRFDGTPTRMPEYLYTGTQGRGFQTVPHV